MPRLAHVISTPSGIGGAERVLAALVREGASNGWDQVVLNPFAEAPEKNELSDLLDSVPYEGRRCMNLLQVPALARWLRDRMRSFAPDLVHVHLFHALAVVSLLPLPGSVRLLTHHHGDLFRSSGRPIKRLIDERCGRRFDRVVAVSDSVRRFLVDVYGYSSERVSCIPNGWGGVPPQSIDAADRPTVVCVANLRREKGHGELLDAIRLVRAEIPDVQLVLVGDGTMRRELESRVTSLGLEGAVDFVGSVTDVWPYLGRAHLFTLASPYETLGIAVMEAMAAGLPVVAVASPAISDLVKPGVTGELVSPGDLKGLAARIIDLLRSAPQREALGRAARQAAASMTMDRTVDAYFDLYEKELARS